MLLPPQCCCPLNVAVLMLPTLNVPAPKMLLPSKYLRRLRWDKRFIAYQPLATSRCKQIYVIAKRYRGMGAHRGTIWSHEQAVLDT